MRKIFSKLVNSLIDGTRLEHSKFINIKEIFSKDLDFQEAEKLLGKLSSEVVLLSVVDLVKNANTSLCKSIRSNLGVCKTEKELLLLNFLEVLVERGAQLQYSGGMNALHKALTDSKLQHLQQTISNTAVLPALLSLIKRKYEWDNIIANDNKQLGLRIRCCEIFQSIQRIGGTTILEQFALSNYSGALIQVVVTYFDECDSVIMTAMDNIALFFSEIHRFSYTFGLERIGNTDIVPQIELIKTSEEQIEEEGGIEEIEAKLLNQKSNGLIGIARINYIYGFMIFLEGMAIFYLDLLILIQLKEIILKINRSTLILLQHKVTTSLFIIRDADHEMP
ncbi:MAG: hypothetical protein EZS28_019909 [Streblomastix strix]|uniref:Uncharacterized protein n=1 Tax=Streblomastix strix TaxID=222440 RepID=A0A5J4VQN5_9EUKA|nr:MAG: hypothetical protein EZS28_019909 [Streblomastix strix]